jgi:hypothetical protein
MRTALFLSTLFLLVSFQSNAGNRAISSTDSPCLACDLPAGMTATNNPDSSATLSWDAVAGATQYNIEIEDEQNNPSNFHIETTVSGTSYTVTGLQAGVKYKFKVRTRCGGDKSDWSDWTFFAASGNGGSGNGSCTIPSGLSVVISGATATLSWNADSTATKFIIEVEDEQNTPSNFHLEDSTTTNSYTLTGLQAGVLYKFKVRARCSSGQSDWSAWLFFNGTTGGGNNGGGSSSGACSTPKNAKAVDITSTSALLVWDTVPGVGSYTLEIERNSPGVNPWKITKLVTTNAFALTGLDTNRRYKFNVRANCSGGGHSDWSKWVKFQTLTQFTTNKTGSASLLNADAASRNTDAVKTEAAAFGMHISPNPATTMAVVRLTGLGTEPVSLRLMDLTGRVVREQTIRPESDTESVRLTVENMPGGLYLLQLSDGQQARTLKLLVSR